VVNQRRTADDGVSEWELGLNLQLPGVAEVKVSWFSDVEVIVGFCVFLWREYYHPIAIGIGDDRTGCGEDIIEVDSENPDIEYLRRFI
jgi:hypothetical protein